MVVAKAQHVYHSTVYDHHDCMRLFKISCLKSVKLIFQQRGGGMVIMHIKIKVPSLQFNSTSGKHYEKMLKTLYKI